MAGEISEAIDRLEARKDAGGLNMQQAGQIVGEDVTRRVWSGLDINLDEVDEIKREIAVSILGGILEGNHPVTVGTGMWFDGLATGLLIAEARDREKATH